MKMPSVVEAFGSGSSESDLSDERLTPSSISPPTAEYSTVFSRDFFNEAYHDSTQAENEWNSTNFLIEQTSTPQHRVRCVNACNQRQFRMSYVIITLALIALVENLILLITVAKLKLGKKCKMLEFLWHFTFADVVISLVYVYYHSRTINVCPKIYTCHPEYTWEMFLHQSAFIICLLSSYFFVLAATVDRFIAIRWSLRYVSLMTTRRVRIISAAIWSFTITLSIIGCILMISWDKRKGHSFLVITVAILCVAAAAGVIILNIANVSYAWSSINRGVHKESSVRRSQHQAEHVRTVSRAVSTRSRVFSKNSLRLTDLQKQNRKLAITLIMFVSSFLVSCTPWPLTLLICTNVNSCLIKQSNVYILVLVVVHAILMPIIYGFRIEDVNHTLRQACRNLVRKIRQAKYPDVF